MKLVGASLLTLGLIFSFVCFVVILVLLYTDNMNIWIAMALTVVINFLMWLVGPWVTDWINKFFYKVRFMTPEEVAAQYPAMAEVVSGVSTQYGFKHPKVGVIPDNNPTAFCYGSGRYNSRLIVTEGLFKYLNAGEQKAVVGHEMGHIVNRDFIVMMVASTLVQLLYEMYFWLSKSKGDRKNNLAAIGFIAYILYIIASYLLLFLSRTRELLADKFGAQVAEPEDLSNALIKIAYGIVSEEDTGTTTRLLHSTRHMGLVDVKDAKHAGGVSYITNNDKQAVTEAMLFDAYSPWAKLIELNSTHPLTGKRVQHLSKMPSKSGRAFSYNVEATASRVMLDKRRLWNVLLSDLAVMSMPYVFAVAAGLATKNWGVGIAAFGLSLVLKTFYRFPGGAPAQTTVLNEMRNPYASPLRGKAVQLQGAAMGRGVPGFVFGEDLMYQDKTGLIFMDYHSAFSFFGNIFFALKKVKKLLGQPSTATGWFYRSIASSLVLRRMDVEGQANPIRSRRREWSFVWAVLFIIAGVLVAAAQTTATSSL
ncbi:M48 family metalloprotease [Candidatus Saccharibacteria bacterium]|nr:MAG: M48 family metalloprotease [Candidatus Saccharibacteria bacterium]